MNIKTTTKTTATTTIRIALTMSSSKITFVPCQRVIPE